MYIIFLILGKKTRLETTIHLFEFLANVAGEVDIFGAEGFDSDGVALVASGSGIGPLHGNVAGRSEFTSDVVRAAGVNGGSQTAIAVIVVATAERH